MWDMDSAGPPFFSLWIRVLFIKPNTFTSGDMGAREPPPPPQIKDFDICGQKPKFKLLYEKCFEIQCPFSVSTWVVLENKNKNCSELHL